jgi:phosphatidate cytidylyltransferase
VVGSVAGKRRVAGSISPNKTVKGTIAGVLVGTAVGAAFVYLYPTNWPAISDKVPVWIVLIVLLLLNGLAQLGDLAESLMKRSAGVKDSGSYIAGHGGILDRFDSHIPVVAAAYYLLVPLV